MIQYLPYIFGTVSFVGGVWLFLFSFKIYEPKAKTEEQKERITKLHSKFGTFIKVISVVLIINGAYDLIARNPERYRIGSKGKTEWQNSHRKELIKKCMNRAPTSVKFPKITKEYCECSSDKIINNLTYQEYVEIMERRKEKRMKALKEVVGGCLSQMRNKIRKKNN
jgi:hypothetical protein